MTSKEKIRIRKIIRDIAKEEGITPKEVRENMQETLDEAWGAAWTPGNLHAQAEWQRMFPGGRKPAVEEFIVITSRSLKE